jgi:UDP-2-acetamido-3-amino-2,3-dideoxy-glucuronate N-acetyltransferase
MHLYARAESKTKLRSSNMKSALHRSDLAPGLLLGDGVRLGDGLRLGAGVVIHGGTSVADGCEIQDGVVLGKAPRLGRRSTAPRGELEPLLIEEGASICTHAVVYAGAHIGAEAIIGDQAQVRERSSIGSGTVIGRACGIENDVMIGTGVRVQSNCFLAPQTTIEDDVFVGPGVVTTNDNAMARHGPGADLSGPTLRRACRIGGGVVLLPGIEVGEEAFIAAGAVVSSDVLPRAVMMGVPARQVREVPEHDLWDRWP